MSDRDNLHPHAEARLAMAMWSHEYSAQNGGCMDFWITIGPKRRRICRDVLDAVLKAQAANGRAPEEPTPGTVEDERLWVLVPREPTDTMRQAFEDQFVIEFAHVPSSPWDRADRLYAAMIAATPSRPVEAGELVPVAGVSDIVWRMRHNADDMNCIMPPFMRTNCHQAADEIESLQARVEELERERDEAREYGGQARIRENEAEDARIREHDRAEALSTRLQEAEKALEEIEASNFTTLHDFKQAIRRARSTLKGEA